MKKILFIACIFLLSSCTIQRSVIFTCPCNCNQQQPTNSYQLKGAWYPTYKIYDTVSSKLLGRYYGIINDTNVIRLVADTTIIYSGKTYTPKTGKVIYK